MKTLKIKLKKMIQMQVVLLLLISGSSLSAESKKRIAIMPFSSDAITMEMVTGRPNLSQKEINQFLRPFSARLSSEFHSALNDRYEIIPSTDEDYQKSLNLLEKQLATGCEEECLVQISQTASATQILTGSIQYEAFSEKFSVNIKLFDAVNQKILAEESDSTANKKEVIDILNSSINILIIQIKSPAQYKKLADERERKRKVTIDSKIEKEKLEANTYKKSVVDEANALKQAEKDAVRRKNAARIAEIDTERRDSLISRSSKIRLSISGLNFMKTGDEEVNSFYTKRWGIMGSYDFVSTGIVSAGLGFEYKNYESSPDITTLSPSTMNIFAATIRIRVAATWYFLGLLWQPYIGIYQKVTMIDEAAKNNLHNTFGSLGIMGAAGVEIVPFPLMGIFAEATYGYTPVGSSRKNLDGFQFLAGISLRM